MSGDKMLEAKLLQGVREAVRLLHGVREAVRLLHGAKEAVRLLLLQAAERSPGLIFDILQAQQPQPAQPSPDVEWCVCGNCRQMPTDMECVCCGNSREFCLSTHHVR